MLQALASRPSSPLFLVDAPNLQLRGDEIDLLETIIDERRLTAVFQPIIDLRIHSYVAFEGLIRGPENTPLDAPKQLFINCSPDCLDDELFFNGGTLKLLHQIGISPSRVVIELTENQRINDYPDIHRALSHYRSLGYQIAIDDLGEGFANLRMWSEIQPDYVKIDRMARPYRRELFGRKSCTHFMDPMPLCIAEDSTVQEAGLIVSRSARRHIYDGFMVTRNGEYLGIGSAHDLMGIITEMQIQAARYANPLTQLPGNVPINEHIERLLARRIGFHACYFDIDHFKPFNDAFGYRKGDDIIVMLAQILIEISNPLIDFCGHIGGDDFMLQFQSEDWKQRCREALRLFDLRIAEAVDADLRTACLRALELPRDQVRRRAEQFSWSDATEQMLAALQQIPRGELHASDGRSALASW